MCSVYNDRNDEQQKKAVPTNAAVSQSETDVSAAVESPMRKLLKREIEAEALERLEKTAKTKEDFDEVIQQWNRRDQNRERKERYHEIDRNDVDFPLELGASIGTNFATNLNMLKQVSKGDFLEVIFDSPYEIQEHMASEYLFEILRDLKQEHKELLYLKAVLGYGCKEIAQMQTCSSRNIRKKWVRLIDKIQGRIYAYLSSEEAQKHHNFTITERAFVTRYEEKLNDEKISNDA